MMRLLAFAILLAFASPAIADCYPPPGLPFQNWYAMCAGTIQAGYANGMGRGMPYDAFVAMLYRTYIGGPGPGMSPQPGPPGVQQCALGAAQCFNGWFRQCQAVGNGTMWITGSRRC